MTGIPLQATAPPTAHSAPAVPFETLLGDVIGAAFGAAVRLSGNRQDAEDLVQEAALRAFRGFHGFQPGTNFRAWFFRILMNLFHSSLRARQHESLEELEDAHPLYLYVSTRDAGWWGQDNDPARLFLDRLAAADIARALNALPAAFRDVSTLYFADDFSYQEIADVLDIPVGTVRSRLHRGRALLQQQLWKIAEDQGLVAGPAPTEGET